LLSSNPSSFKYVVREAENDENRTNSISELTKEHSKDDFIINDLYLSFSIKILDYCVINFDIIIMEIIFESY